MTDRPVAERVTDERVDAPPREVRIVPVPGIGEVVAGDDLAAELLRALREADEPLRAGDVVVVSSKVVSKAEGRSLAAPNRDAAIETQTLRVVAERVTPRGVTRIVASRSGPVLAAAGVDASNVAPGTVLLLPVDPDASARRLHAALVSATGVPLGVIVSDTAGRPWRDGQVDLAIGAAGVRVTDDLRGATDGYGNPLEVTVRALADEIAAAADLVKGKLAGVPVAVFRGLTDVLAPADSPGAAALLRDGAGDWFALGHVEAVRTALGAPPGTPGVSPLPVLPDGLAERLDRALAVARAGVDPFGVPGSAVTAAVVGAPDDGRLRLSGPGAGGGPGLAAFTQRLATAASAEGLTVHAEVDGSAVVVTVRRAGRPAGSPDRPAGASAG